MAHKCDGCQYKGEHQEMMFRPFGVCIREINLIEAERAYNSEKCPYRKTNANRIRLMSDEELLTFLCDTTECGLCRWGEPQGCTLDEWLKQPAEGE